MKKSIFSAIWVIGLLAAACELDNPSANRGTDKEDEQNTDADTDTDTDSDSDGNTDPDGFSCVGANCDEGCTEGGCDIVCTGDMDCACEGGGCIMSCADGARCSCAGGGCVFTCAGGAQCDCAGDDCYGDCIGEGTDCCNMTGTCTGSVLRCGDPCNP